MHKGMNQIIAGYFLLAGVSMVNAQIQVPSFFKNTLVDHSYQLKFSPLYRPALVPLPTTIPVSP